MNKAFRSDSVLDDNVADIKIFEYVGLFQVSQMERQRTNEREPGPVPLVVPVDRFGFLKQEHGNSSPHRFTKTRSSSNYDKYVLMKNCCF